MIKSIFNWSGGKDSALALYRIIKDREYEVVKLVTTTNGERDRISMHGVRTSLLDLQSKSLDLPLQKVILSEMPAMEEYNATMRQMLTAFKEDGVTHSIFGDIFLEDLKAYRDERLSEVAMQGYYPLWKEDSYKLFNEFVTLGFRAVIVCTNARYLDESFLGRELDHELLNDLPNGVDPCGEKGEYHTFVFDGPIFDFPIGFRPGETLFRNYESGDSGKHDTGFWYLDLLEQ